MNGQALDLTNQKKMNGQALQTKVNNEDNQPKNLDVEFTRFDPVWQGDS